MNIEDLIGKIKGKKIKWRGHASKRILERNITREDTIESILHGEIIEEYPDDFPFPSCLVLGYTEDGMPLHIVCSIGQDNLWIVTVYRPDPNKWGNNFNMRKG